MGGGTPNSDTRLIEIPSPEGNEDEYLTTDGQYLYWKGDYVLPDHNGHQGDVLVSTGEEAAWKKIGEVVPIMRTKTNLPLGYFFSWPYPSGLDGTIPANGSTYSRDEYPDLWEYLFQHPDWIKEEIEWQEIAASSNGYCPYYATGNGTTTFRTPKFAPYRCYAGTPGTYQVPGLPNITSDLHSTNDYAIFNTNAPAIQTTGAFSVSSKYDGYVDSGGSVNPDWCGHLMFDASRSDPIYGQSNTVQPESHVWNIFIVAA